MKPTQEQVIAWAEEAGMREGDIGDWTTADAALTYPECVYTENLERFAALAYEAGRKDENEAIADAVSKCDARATPKGIAAAIRARREQ